MASLTAHLTDNGDHGRLGFHPGCPACRDQRLFGSLSSDAVISRRTRAALASGVLALSAAGPSVALAQEPDQQVDGAPGAEQATGGGGADSSPLVEAPAEDPDGDRTLTLADPSDSELTEDIPIETEPVESPGPPAVPSPEAKDDPKPTSEQLQPEIGPRPTSPASPTESPVLVEAPPEAAPAGPAPLPDDPGPEALQPEQTAETGPRDHSVPETPLTEAAPAAPIAARAIVDPAPATETALTSVSSAAPPNAEPASARSGRFLLVQPGDSLWSIAKRALGPDASSAKIAREVNRLWQLNSDQIGTGSPDLITVGTKLRLR